MKLILTAMFATVSAFAGILPQGTYTGIGDVEMEGGPGLTYRSTTVVGADDSVSYEFRWGTEVKKISMQLTGTSEAFDIVEKGKKTGSGGCDGVRCDYTVNPAENVEVRETLVFSNGKILRFGTKKDNGKLFTWYHRELK